MPSSSSRRRSSGTPRTRLLADYAVGRLPTRACGPVVADDDGFLIDHERAVEQRRVRGSHDGEGPGLYRLGLGTVAVASVHAKRRTKRDPERQSRECLEPDHGISTPASDFSFGSPAGKTSPALPEWTKTASFGHRA